MSTLTKSVGIVAVGTVTDQDGVDHAVCNAFAYYTTDTLSGPFLLRFQGAFDANVMGVIAPLLHEDYVAGEYLIYFPARFDPGAGSAGLTGQNGAVTGDRLPLSQCVNMGLQTAVRGRNFRGLKRFGPIAEGDTTGDELSSTAASSWSAAATAVGADLADGFGVTWHPIVVSRKLTAAHPTALEVIGERITSVRLNKTLGFARHRRERGNYP